MEGEMEGPEKEEQGGITVSHLNASKIYILWVLGDFIRKGGGVDMFFFSFHFVLVRTP